MGKETDRIWKLLQDGVLITVEGKYDGGKYVDKGLLLALVDDGVAEIVDKEYVRIRKVEDERKS